MPIRDESYYKKRADKDVRHTILLALFAGTLVQSSCKSTPPRVTFEARVADLRKPSNSFGQNKAPEDLLELSLPGKLFQPPSPLTPVRRSEADWSTPEHAAASIISANASGDVAWMVENFVPQERERVAKQLADPDAVRRVRDYYANAGKVAITASVEIRGYTALFLLGRDSDGDPTFLSAVLSKTPQGWRETNALVNDDTFDLVSAALHTSGAH